VSTGVILLAAGIGRRFGGTSPKQFLSLNNKPLYQHSLSVFRRIPSVGEIVLVVSPAKVASFQKMKFAGLPHMTVTAGGSYRGESVRNGLRAFRTKPSVVLIHDSARPLVDSAMVRNVESAAKKFGVALAAWPLPDTLKEEKNGMVKRTIPRKNLWLAQTPQGFRWSIAVKCLIHPRPDATDDVDLAQRKGFKVKIVIGSPKAMKVTVPMDLKIVRKINSL
jgi:2-C-methyl-D-erythritol 4-phosphate cytidylyltransferase